MTSLTFSLTVVTLQLASSQFSPRLLRTFTRDRLVHVSLGLLLATFTYALTVLRTVRASLVGAAAFVPQISVTVAYLLALASVLGLVVFLAHLARQIRVEWMLRKVHADTDTTMRRVLSEQGRHHGGAAGACPRGAAVRAAIRVSDLDRRTGVAGRRRRRRRRGVHRPAARRSPWSRAPRRSGVAPRRPTTTCRRPAGTP